MFKNGKIILYLCVFSSFLSGCVGNAESSKTEKTDIETSVAEFYKTDYDFEESYIRYDEQGNEYAQMYVKGTVIRNPFQIHMKYLNPNSKILEMYMYGDEAHPDRIALTNDSDEWKKINSGVYAHEYGYSRVLKFEKDREESINDKKTLVYTTSYVEDMGKTYRMDQEIPYTIYQEYYMDKETLQLVRIITDTTDARIKKEIAQMSQMDSISVEEAAEKVANDKNIKNASYNKEILDIYNYGNAANLSIPNVQ